MVTEQEDGERLNPLTAGQRISRVRPPHSFQLGTSHKSIKGEKEEVGNSTEGIIPESSKNIYLNKRSK